MQDILHFLLKALTLPSTPKSLINLELTFVCDVKQGPISNASFPHGLPIVLAPFAETFPTAL